MIGWLQGERIDSWEQGSRKGLLINCSGVGYEVQLAERHLHRLSDGSHCTLWIHQVQKDDGCSLFGFPERQERDLFRILIAVNGVGPQMGLSLLECCTPEELVNAILEGDLRRLSQAQGVGKRMAERLAVELRERLASWSQRSEAPLSLVDRSDVKALPIQAEALQELEVTLMALGYEDLEIRRALRAVAAEVSKPEASDGDAWLRESLRRLSLEAG